MKPRTSRRRFLAHVASGVFCLPAAARSRALQGDSCGERFVGRTIRWIVPNRIGGGNDAYSRLLEPFLESRLGAQVRIDNQPGAGGLIGARALREATPDGYTLGILNGPGLLTAFVSGIAAAPNPATDFTILGRIARSRQVWATGRNSGIRTLDDAIRRSERGPLVFGVREVGGTAFVNIAVTSDLLALPIEIVTGFVGNRDASLAALRGDVDLVAYTFESVRDRILTGDLRPLLQISDVPISDDPALAGVALLGGADGVAARRAAALGRSVTEATRNAQGISALIEAGRLIAAPPGLEPDLLRCLERAVAGALSDGAFVSSARSANRSLDVAGGREALETLRAAATYAQRFAAIVADAIRRVR